MSGAKGVVGNGDHGAAVGGDGHTRPHWTTTHAMHGDGSRVHTRKRTCLQLQAEHKGKPTTTKGLTSL